MSKLLHFLLAVLTIITFTQCDNNTESVGSSIVPSQDVITARTDTFYAKSRTILANDSILASSSDVYLGYFSDPESGTVFESSFITQFGCTEESLTELTDGVVAVSFSADGTLASIPPITRDEAYEIYKLAL